ncbi:hypothetical protein BP5796_05213 [Coleophoma crateriformis]|uniref:Uncharacterized protein n=1 Tax=Coleophoma crateriformis TaxID=565419 RepID=A0A3D8S2L2_9HELO|nr:hypothetical protein BP5796_05213 [Coleophoma crateriformis]
MTRIGYARDGAHDLDAMYSNLRSSPSVRNRSSYDDSMRHEYHRYTPFRRTAPQRCFHGSRGCVACPPSFLKLDSYKLLQPPILDGEVEFVREFGKFQPAHTESPKEACPPVAEMYYWLAETEYEFPKYHEDLRNVTSQQPKHQPVNRQNSQRQNKTGTTKDALRRISPQDKAKDLNAVWHSPPGQQKQTYHDGQDQEEVKAPHPSNEKAKEDKQAARRPSSQGSSNSTKKKNSKEISDSGRLASTNPAMHTGPFTHAYAALGSGLGPRPGYHIPLQRMAPDQRTRDELSLAMEEMCELTRLNLERVCISKGFHPPWSPWRGR